MSEGKVRMQPARRLRAILEPLEARQLLSVTPVIGALDPSSGQITTSGAINGTAGIPVFVNADLPAPGTTDPSMTQMDDSDAGAAAKGEFSWKFLNSSGTPDGKYGQLPGFNAAHVFDAPGTYTVQLTITNQNGETGTVSRTISIAARPTTTLYINADAADDSGNGTSSTSPVQSITKLQSLLDALPTPDSNVQVFFKGGTTHTYDVATSLFLGSNVIVSTYGGTANATLNWTGSASDTHVISTHSALRNVEIDNITLQCTTGANSTGTLPRGMDPPSGSWDIGMRNVQFINMDDAINGEGIPDGILVQDSKAPNADNIRSYFSFVEGQNWVFLGDTVENSVTQHDIRANEPDNGLQYVLIYGNTMSNVFVNSGDAAKSVLDLQRGNFFWIADNASYGGHLGAAPLDGNNAPTSYDTGNQITIQDVVFEGNKLIFDPAIYGATARADDCEIQVKAGALHVVLRNNVIDDSAVTQALEPTFRKGGSTDILIAPQDTESTTIIHSGLSDQETEKAAFEGRYAQDILVAHNTLVDSNVEGFANGFNGQTQDGVGGAFLEVWFEAGIYNVDSQTNPTDPHMTNQDSANPPPTGFYHEQFTAPSAQIQFENNLCIDPNMQINTGVPAAPIYVNVGSSTAGSLFDFTKIDHNIFPSPHFTGPNGGINYVSASPYGQGQFYSPTSWTTLGQSYGLNTGSDVFTNAVTVDPNYVPGSYPSTETPSNIPGVFNDFYGITRPATNPTIGAVQIPSQTDVNSPLPAGAITPTRSAASDYDPVGGYDISGGGNQLGGLGGSSSNNDSLKFTSQSVSGDFVATVRVAAFGSGTSTFAKAGIMVRQDTTGGSPDAFIEAENTKAPNFNYRTTAGQATAFGTQASSFSATNEWLQLKRTGNNLFASVSTDGVNWTPILVNGVDHVTINMTDPVDVGLAFTNNNATGDNTSSGTAQFRDFSVSPISSGFTGTLDAFDFNGKVGDEISDNPALVATNVSGGAISRGSGLTANVQGQRSFDNSISSTPTNGLYGTDLASAESLNEFDQFTIAPTAGHTLSLSTLGFSAWDQNAHSTFAGGLTYSTDGVNFTSVPLSGSLANAFWNGPVEAVSADLSGVSALQGVSGTVTFRIYLYGAGNDEDTGIGRTNGGAGSNSDLFVNGTVN